MRIERDELLRLDSSLGRTWLETDGVGGYAASTLLLCATSRYHGLLVAAPRGSTKRHVFLSRFEETLVAQGREFPLSTARYGGGVLSPQGQQFAAAFETTPFPTWTYRIGDVEVVREILLVRGAPTALVRWKLVGGDAKWTLRLRPMLPCREADALTFANVYAVREARHVPHGIAVRPYASLPAVSMTTSRPAQFASDPQWYRGVEFEDDLARGYGGHEDQLTPGWFDVPMPQREEFVVAATIAERVVDPAGAWATQVRERRRAASTDAIERAAEQFLFRAPSGRLGVVAGFPWFGEWGRDTCISLPGLLLPRGRVAECGAALVELARHVRRGRLPNRFGAGPETSEYKASDPAMWFARAVRLWELAGGDDATLRTDLFPVLAEIARGHRDSRSDDLFLDDAGLLVAKSTATAATWMDAVQDGVAVTPRSGCAVEVNALWCFLLDYLARLAKRTGRRGDAREFGEMKRRAFDSFRARFWLADDRRLADAWKDGVADRAVRPNMVIAAALEFSPLSKTQRAACVDLARAELVTPRGLRTLSPRDPEYRGRYEGDVRSRDAAYHQGTVWPWLLGFYAEAFLRAHGRGAAAKRHVRELLDEFDAHVDERCLGQVSEVFDGDPPHRAGGAWAQAWSVAELLRARALVA